MSVLVSELTSFGSCEAKQLCVSSFSCLILRALLWVMVVRVFCVGSEAKVCRDTRNRYSFI